MEHNKDIEREISLVKSDLIKDIQKTENEKNIFISQIKGGLGKEIKESGSKIKVIKRSRFNRFILKIKKIFNSI